MNDMKIKAKIIALVFVWLAGSLFVQGCAMNHGVSVTSSAEFFVADLSSGSEYQQILGGQPQTCGMRSGRVYLRPGETCGQHSTDAHEELLVFLSGKGISLIGEEQTPHEVGAGKVCYIPPYTIHNNKNTGAEPLVYIYCVAPVDEHDENHDEHGHH
ncbi:MAG: cupin domain-containing protein [Sedimentisphaerales bacterium]|jgi:mannose-6-phosphate isomerase-like protein (cupin superfamily)